MYINISRETKEEREKKIKNCITCSFPPFLALRSFVIIYLKTCSFWLSEQFLAPQCTDERVRALFNQPLVM